MNYIFLILSPLFFCVFVYMNNIYAYDYYLITKDWDVESKNSVWKLLNETNDDERDFCKRIVNNMKSIYDETHQKPSLLYSFIFFLINLEYFRFEKYSATINLIILLSYIAFCILLMFATLKLSEKANFDKYWGKPIKWRDYETKNGQLTAKSEMLEIYEKVITAYKHYDDNFNIVVIWMLFKLLFMAVLKVLK